MGEGEILILFQAMHSPPGLFCSVFAWLMQLMRQLMQVMRQWMVGMSDQSDAGCI